MASPKKPKVLNDSHRELLNKLLRACRETSEFLGKCKSCHLDVDREIDANAEQEKIATALKATFFPSQV